MRADRFPVSAKGTAIAVKLIVAYAVLVVNTAVFYLLATGVAKVPLNYVFLVAVAGVSAWALYKQKSWSLLVLVAFFGWQLYVGISGVFMYFIAVVRNNSAEAITLVALLASRTILVVVLFLVLSFHALRNRMHSAQTLIRANKNRKL